MTIFLKIKLFVVKTALKKFRNLQVSPKIILTSMQKIAQKRVGI
jgi:hypothetical protein